jgi:Zn-dependent protease
VSESPLAQANAAPAESGVGQAPASEVVRAELSQQPAPRRFGRRRIGLPLTLFLLTCGSTFFAGATGWQPGLYVLNELFSGSLPQRSLQLDFFLDARQAVLAHWQDGLIYMGCILAILLTHEMGHFVMTVIYRVRASLPIFLPLPISPIGTLGAVIAMDGSQANRKQIFDIGLAGPLAGLAVAIPIIWIGAVQLDLKDAPPSDSSIELPLALRLLVDYLHPGAYQAKQGVPFTALNPYFMAGWVGLLVTALNMLPVSQLDGGHVTYTLFGRAAHWAARLFMFIAFVYLAVAAFFFNQPPFWLLMALLVLVLGADHPPTADDRMPLGWGRTILGAASLLIPVFCFSLNPLRM